MKKSSPDPAQTRWQWGKNRTESKPQAFTTSTAHLRRAEAESGTTKTPPRLYMRGAVEMSSDAVSSPGVPDAQLCGLECARFSHLESGMAISGAVVSINCGDALKAPST